MKSILFAVVTILVSSQAFAANGAKIVGKNEEDKTITIALDASGTPRENANNRTYPTIKDFRETSDYYDYCYEGTVKEAKDLLEALVAAADGDGDSWADLKSIKVDRNNVIHVTADITDESGKNEESYEFPSCP